MTADERRAIRLDVEVPGTPEQVWEAIATGPGISAWFVAAEVEPREGGEIVLDFGSGMVERSHVTAWEPPHRFAYGVEGERGRALAMELLVEARGGGTCVVRLIISGFGSGAEWDAEFDGMEGGWKLFLANLVLYMTHFRGQPSGSLIVNGTDPGPAETALARLTGALGLPSALALGDAVATSGEGVPRLAGEVVRVTGTMVTLLTHEPARGTAFVAAESGGTAIWTSLYGYFFGDEAAAVAEREKPLWEAWMAEHFPLPARD
jgi:uncharacterized protein YndB with AHSA1/START domain